MARTYRSEYKGKKIETYRLEGHEYVQRGQVSWSRKVSHWGVKVDGKVLDHGLATKANAIAFAQRTIDRSN